MQIDSDIAQVSLKKALQVIHSYLRADPDEGSLPFFGEDPDFRSCCKTLAFGLGDNRSRLVDSRVDGLVLSTYITSTADNTSDSEIS